MASAAAGAEGAQLPPLMTMFSDIKKLTINDGKFTQVLGDYHFHANAESIPVKTPFADSNTHQSTNESSPTTPSSTPTQGAIQVGGDYHHHVHHHYPRIKRRTRHLEQAPDVRIEVSTALPDEPHYHVWRGEDIMFCTRFSPVYLVSGLPEYPPMEDMKKYMRIIMDKIDAGVYRDMGVRRTEYFRRYMPDIWPDRYPMRLWPRHQTFVPPKRDYNVKDYVPPFDFNGDWDNNKENIYMYPCMHAHAAASSRKSSVSSASSPREALFSHLDHSGVK